MSKPRNVPQGTFVVLAIIAFGLIAMAAYAVHGLVQLSFQSVGVGHVDHEPLGDAAGENGPVGVGALSIIAVELIRNVIRFGDPPDDEGGGVFE